MISNPPFYLLNTAILNSNFNNSPQILTNPRRTKLIKSLQHLKVTNSDLKMVSIDKIEHLVRYCSEYTIDCKRVCKEILIAKFDNIHKRVKYRGKQQIQWMIKEMVRYLKSMRQNGDIILMQSEQEQPKQENQQCEKILEILYPSEKCQLIVKWDLNNDLLNIPKKIRNNFPDQFNKIISHQFIRRLTTKLLVMQALTILDTVSISLSLTRLTTDTISQIKTQKTQILQNNITTFRMGIQYHRILATQKVLGYFKTFLAIKKYRKRVRIEEINKLFIGFQGYIDYTRKRQTYKIKSIQRSIRAYLQYKKSLKILESQFITKHQQLYQQNRLKYNKLTHQLNTLFDRNSRTSYYGDITCVITIINIQNWGNCSLFSPQHLSEFFKNSLFKKVDKKTHEVPMKINVEGGHLKLICVSGNEYSYGFGCRYQTEYEQNMREKATINEKLCEFRISSSGIIYAKGSNIYGQLGIPFHHQQVPQWTQVPIRASIKQVENHFHRTVCLTTENQLYHWGRLSQTIAYEPTLVDKPLILKNKQIQQIACTIRTVLVLTSDFEIIDLYRGTRIRSLNFKREVDERAIITTGSTFLEITYGIGIKVECYDRVKHRRIVEWLKKQYCRKKNENQDDTLLIDGKENDQKYFNTN